MSTEYQNGDSQQLLKGKASVPMSSRGEFEAVLVEK
jgi:hypothetical protein